MTEEAKPRKQIRCVPAIWDRVEQLSIEKGLSFNKMTEILIENGIKYNAMLDIAKAQAEKAMKAAIAPIVSVTKKKETVSYMGLDIDPSKINIR